MNKQNQPTKWLPEACYHCPGTPYLLVGLNPHLRNDPATIKALKSRDAAPVTIAQATEQAKRMKAVKYIEYALHESAAVLFDEALRAVVHPSTRLQKVVVFSFIPPPLDLFFLPLLFSFMGLSFFHSHSSPFVTDAETHLHRGWTPSLTLI